MLHPTLSAGLLGTLLAVSPGNGRATAVRGRELPAPSVAAPTISDMDMEIWPEYDDPRVLVIYEGRLSEGVKLPARITFVVPDSAQINMAGGIDANGQHIHAAYQTRDQGEGFSEISFELTVPVFHVEFYYAAFGAGDRRSFTYGVVAPFATDTMDVRVQEPRRATGFQVSPATKQMTQDANGFSYYVIQLDTAGAGRPTPISVSYTKTDREPSVAAQNDAATPPARQSPFEKHRTAVYLLALVAVASIGVGLFPHVRIRRPRSYAANRPEGPGRRGDTPPDPGTAPRFCTECGAELANGARYCGMCGQPIRSAKHRVGVSA